MPTDAVRTVVSIAAGNHSVVSRKAAAASGMSPHNIDTAKRRGWLLEPAPGVLVIAGSPDTWRRRGAIVLGASDHRARLSHRAAATLLRMDGFADPDARPRIVTDAPANVRRLGPVHADPVLDVLVEQPYSFHLPPTIVAQLHQTDRFDPSTDEVIVDGLACTSVARTLCDLGAVCSEDTVWNALISARRRRELSPRWLAATALRLQRPGPTGSRTIRRLLHRWAEEGTLPDTWLEELMSRLLRDARIPEVVRQYVVEDATGRFVARVDAAIPAARLALEGHSRRFHFGPVREAADEDRDLRLAAAGFETLYLGWYSARSPGAVADQIRGIVHERLALFAKTA